MDMDGTRDRSVVDLLRKCAAQDHGMARIRDALGVGLESGWQQRCLAEVADMMEAELDGIEELEAELEAEREEAAFWETRYYNEVKKRTKAEQCIAVMEFPYMELHDALKAICNRFGVSTEWAAEDAAKKVLAVLEREYMKLPVDANCVPIRPGDEMQMAFGESAEVVAVGSERWFFDHSCLADNSDEYDFELAANSRHVKHDTVEGILGEAIQFGANADTGTRLECVISDYAERIQKAVER